MTCDFNNERPIYLQLEEQIKNDIVVGKLEPGKKIPSVREYALLTKVNPNTMQKALSELEKDGLIYTERTNGKYVTNNLETIKKLRDDLIEKEIKTFLSSMKNLGINEEKLIKLLKERGNNNELN